MRPAPVTVPAVAGTGTPVDGREIPQGDVHVIPQVRAAVEVPAGMLEPHRSDHAAEVHGIGRRVRPLARVDLPVDVGRGRGDERLELDRWRVMCLGGADQHPGSEQRDAERQRSRTLPFEANPGPQFSPSL